MTTVSSAALVPGSYESALQEVVTARFGFDSLTTDQDHLVRASIEGNDVLGILPTGSGKSACFQIPGIVTRSHTLVVSPLIALQDDQVQQLRHIGVRAFAFHSNQPDPKRMAIKFYYGCARPHEASFLYISPELLLTELFHDVFKHARFERIAVDEAHCVSTWGNSFRPDYQRIKVAVKRMHIPICSAFTATVDPRIEADIRERTPIKPDHVRVAVSPMRENLSLVVRPVQHFGNVRVNAMKRREVLCDTLADPKFIGPAIVYCSSINIAATLYLRLREYKDWLRHYGFSPYLFHSELPYDDKRGALHGFLNRPRPIVIATSAFGMGINRSNVRQIVHYQVPFTLIDFAQQIGRAGRDGLPARCTSFVSPFDIHEPEVSQVSRGVPDYAFVERVHRNIRRITSKMDSVQRKGYNLGSFLRRMQHIVDNTDQIHSKERYMDRVRSAVALLQRAKVVRENGDGLAVINIDPGGPVFMRLNELTEMHLRMQLREYERIREFFGHPAPSQELLWEILKRD